jgi:hypothetical protein
MTCHLHSPACKSIVMVIKSSMYSTVYRGEELSRNAVRRVDLIPGLYRAGRTVVTGTHGFSRIVVVVIFTEFPRPR